MDKYEFIGQHGHLRRYCRTCNNVLPIKHNKAHKCYTSDCSVRGCDYRKFKILINPKYRYGNINQLEYGNNIGYCDRHRCNHKPFFVEDCVRCRVPGRKLCEVHIINKRIKENRCIYCGHVPYSYIILGHFKRQCIISNDIFNILLKYFYVKRFITIPKYIINSDLTKYLCHFCNKNHVRNLSCDEIFGFAWPPNIHTLTEFTHNGMVYYNSSILYSGIDNPYNKYKQKIDIFEDLWNKIDVDLIADDKLQKELAIFHFPKVGILLKFSPNDYISKDECLYIMTGIMSEEYKILITNKFNDYYYMSKIDNSK